MKLWKKYMERGKTMFAWAGLLSLLVWTGCATTAMKATPFYTGEQTVYRGNAADRVNLWPLAYWYDPAGSVAWPICSFSDDHVAFRPIYSQYRQSGREGAYDEFNLLWPLIRADTRRKDYRVFPFFWGQDTAGEPYQCLFPVYWHDANYHSLYPIWFYKSTDDSDWTFFRDSPMISRRMGLCEHRSFGGSSVTKSRPNRVRHSMSFSFPCGGERWYLWKKIRET